MWRERRKLVEVWRMGRAAAMATLVAVEGSSYCKPGARLMVGAVGQHVGSISGGCLESEVVRKAPWLIRNGACVQRYSTVFDDSAEIPYGLGCGGTVDILLEPAGTAEFELLMNALAMSLEGVASNVHTELPHNGQPLRRTLMPPETAESNEISGSEYVERIHAPQRLLVFGGGDDVQALVSMASLLGWRVIVVDARPDLARAERFPDAESVLVARPGSALTFQVQPDDFAVVMTHHYEHDRGWLEMLLPTNLHYVGLLGARHRSAQLANELSKSLQWSIEEICSTLRAPVGLDLGGDGAETIALAILAEMQACASHRPLASRRLTSAAVAEQMTKIGDAAPAPQACMTFAEAGS